MAFVPNDELAQFLRTFRAITGWSTADLAKAANLSDATLRRVMNAGQKMDMTTYENLITFFVDRFPKKGGK